LSLQLAGSRTRIGDVTKTAPLWLGQFTIQHRVWGLRSVFAGISDDFYTGSGFIGRNGIVHSYVDPSYTAYGKPGALLERFTGDILVDGIWQYQSFIHNRGIQDQKLHFNVNTTLRGGWNVGAGYFVESFGYDSALYAKYRLEFPNGGGGLDTIPFVGQPTIPNGEYIVQSRRAHANSAAAVSFAGSRREPDAPADPVPSARLLYRPTDRPAPVQPFLAAGEPSHRRHAREAGVSRATSITTCPDRCPWRSDILPADRFPARRFADQRPDPDRRTERRVADGPERNQPLSCGRAAQLSADAGHRGVRGLRERHA
jgi:hypothetical protein